MFLIFIQPAEPSHEQASQKQHEHCSLFVFADQYSCEISMFRLLLHPLSYLSYVLVLGYEINDWKISTIRVFALSLCPFRMILSLFLTIVTYYYRITLVFECSCYENLSITLFSLNYIEFPKYQICHSDDFITAPLHSHRPLRSAGALHESVPAGELSRKCIVG